MLPVFGSTVTITDVTLPMVSMTVPAWSVVLSGYAFTLLTSGFVVKLFVGSPPGKRASKAAAGTGATKDGDNNTGDDSSEERDVGRIIGKCENILAVTLILANAVTGLALLVAAKSIVRAEDMKKDSRYYLGGTLVNLTYSVVIAYGLRVLLR